MCTTGEHGNERKEREEKKNLNMHTHKKVVTGYLVSELIVMT